MTGALIVMISTYVWNLGQTNPMAGIKEPLPSKYSAQLLCRLWRAREGYSIQLILENAYHSIAINLYMSLGIDEVYSCDNGYPFNYVSS